WTQWWLLGRREEGLLEFKDFLKSNGADADQLRNLNLSYNLFSGWIDNQGFEGLSSLRKLEKLDLGSNLFNDSNIFRYLGALASIKTLIVSHNSLGGYFPAHGTFSLHAFS
ncbi:Receptor-like protein 45, partial [Camellia lanceoleosa]